MRTPTRRFVDTRSPILALALGLGACSSGGGDADPNAQIPELEPAAANSSYGLDTVTPVGAYFNSVFPDAAPQPVSSYTLTPAFPNLRFNDILVAKEAPRNGRMYVAQRDGVIHSFPNDPNATTKTPFLTTPNCAVVWDGGFLGLAFHPEFGDPSSANRNYVYTYYCYNDTGTYPNSFGASQGAYFFDCYLRLSRWRVPDGSLQVDPNSEDVMFHIRMYNGSHRGGDIQFGNDGMLYVPVGDQFRYETAQDIANTLEGGFLRIDVDRDPSRSHAPRRTFPLTTSDEYSGRFYWIPNDNPWQSPSGATFEEYWTIGHRNPHRMTLDPVTGWLWSGEIGGGQREEINVIKGGGGNYGWPFREGLTTGVRTQPASVLGSVIDPALDFTRSEANAIIGGYVYRGAEHAALYGKYICGGYSQDRIWALDYDPATGTATKQLIATFIPELLSTFGTDLAGEIYLGGLGTNRPLYKLAAAGTNAIDPPPLLSQTGVFTDMANLTPAPELIPYGLNVPFWSDGALKSRWIAVPNDGDPNTVAETIQFSQQGRWQFPAGTVLVKHFELPTDESDPNVTRRLETRFIVIAANGGHYGVTYRWRPDGSEADLLTAGATDTITVQTRSGPRTQTWTYPDRASCLNCHNASAGGVLGPSTHQLNGDWNYPSTGVLDNQLRAWNNVGLFRTPIDENAIPNMPRAGAPGDESQTIEQRTNAYVDSNCAHCHQPGTGNRSPFDARYQTPLGNIINETVLDDLGIAGARFVVPRDLTRSVVHHRVLETDNTAMPPPPKELVDPDSRDLLSRWILSLDDGTPNVPLGNPVENLNINDQWASNMLVELTKTHTNETGAPQNVRVDAFRFYAGRTTNPITPFLVKVSGSQPLEVLAVGDTRAAGSYAIGANTVPFRDGTAPVVTLAPGENVAAGCIDANADGSGGADRGVVRFEICNGASQVWYSGGPTAGDAGSIVEGLPPFPGSRSSIKLRNYAFTIDICLCGTTSQPTQALLGNDAVRRGWRDQWNSNMVINTTDTFTNNTGAPLDLDATRFLFYAARQADPVTPFLVRVNGPSDFTVVAVGTTRTSAGYGVGTNVLPFADGATPSVTLQPGETLAAGFLDAAADGTGGGNRSVIPFLPGSDSMWYTGGPDGSDAGAVQVGTAPINGTRTSSSLNRDYSFSIEVRS